MTTTRNTLIRILRLCATAPTGVYRGQLLRSFNKMSSNELSRIRDNDWLDKGLRGLIHEELLPNHRNRPSTRWFITPAGRDFLRRISVNPYALPDIPAGKQPYQSLEARLYAERKQYRARRRRRAQRKYWAVRANPKYDAAVYDAPLDARRLPSIGGKGWRELDAVIKIRLLRQRVRRRSLEARFKQIAQEA